MVKVSRLLTIFIALGSVSCSEEKEKKQRWIGRNHALVPRFSVCGKLIAALWDCQNAGIVKRKHGFDLLKALLWECQSIGLR
ncbi:hypothetical protein [Prevotella sp.]|uniref:hypothetical protein n=1 Tax=Prevotella sp. TaxID=59823 RepID=UPI002F91EB71